MRRSIRVFFLHRWQQAALKLRGLLRSNVLLPLDPSGGRTDSVWTDVSKALVLPSWHCAFAGCAEASCGWQAGDSHEEGLWNHLWISGKHKIILLSLVEEYNLNESSLNSEEAAFTLYNQALLEAERESCPLRGLATDRRAALHLGEVFTEDNVSTLMCFICSCKHIRHMGWNKVGKQVSKGTIDYRDGPTVATRIFSHSESWTLHSHPIGFASKRSP